MGYFMVEGHKVLVEEFKELIAKYKSLPVESIQPYTEFFENLIEFTLKYKDNQGLQSKIGKDIYEMMKYVFYKTTINVLHHSTRDYIIIFKMFDSLYKLIARTLPHMEINKLSIKLTNKIIKNIGEWMRQNPDDIYLESIQNKLKDHRDIVNETYQKKINRTQYRLFNFSA